MVAAAAPAVTSDAFCDRPPAARTTAVCEVPPPAGIAPNSAPPRLAAPVAISSRFALIGGSSGRAKARPAAIVSVKLISAIPSAPGTSCSISARSGSVSDGNPCGIRPTVETPSACRPKNHDAAMPPPTATSGAGECGQSRSMPISTSSVAAATASVISEVSGTCCATLRRSRKKPCLAMWMPRSFGTWSSTITRPMPALKPVSTGVEMKLATNPRRSSRRQQQHRADQRGQRGRRRDELRRVAVRHGQAELRAGQDRQRGGGADAEHPRRAEQRVDRPSG